jgi:hypothetical protein
MSVIRRIVSDDDAGKHWAMEWLTGVADGSKRTSQRKLTLIERRGGGLKTIKAVAQALGVHLLLLENEDGVELIAASKKPFKIIC